MSPRFFHTVLLAVAVGTVTVRAFAASAPSTQVVLVPQVGHAVDIKSIAFSDDGHLVGTIDENRRLNVWSATSRRLLYSHAIPTRGARILRFSRDANRIFLTGDDGLVDFDLGNEQARILRKDLRPQFLLDDDRTYLRTAGSGRGVVIGNLDSGKESLVPGSDVGGLSQIAIARSQRLAALAFQSSSDVLIVDTASGEVRTRLPVARNPLRAMAMSDDGLYVALVEETGSRPRPLAVYSVPGGKAMLMVDAPGRAEFQTLAFVPGSHRLVVGGEELGGIKIFDVAAAREVAAVPHLGRVTALDLGGKPPRLAVAAQAGVELHDLPAAPAGGRIDEAVGLSSQLLRSFDGRYYAILRRDGALSVRAAADDRPVFPTKLAALAKAVFAGAGAIVFQRDRALWSRDLVSRSETRLVEDVPSVIEDLDASADGLVIAFRGLAERAVTVLRYVGGEIRKQDLSFAQGVEHIALSPDGRLLFVQGGDNVARIHDALTGAILTTLEQGVSTGHLKRARFSLDGRRLAYLTDDVIRVWHGPPWGAARRLTFADSVEDFDFRPEAGKFWVATSGGVLAVDIADPKARTKLSDNSTRSLIGLPATPGALMAVTREGVRQVFGTAGAGKLDVLAAADASLIQMFDADGGRNLVAYVQDRARARMRINVWSGDRGTLICDVENGMAGLHGNQAIVPKGGDLIEIVGLDDCQVRSQFRINDSITVDHALSLPDGHILVADASGRFAVVEPTTGKTINAHKVDADMLKTRLFQPASGAPRILYTGHDGRIIYLLGAPAFSEDMRIALQNEHLGFAEALAGTDFVAVATFGERNMLRVWDLTARAVAKEIVLPMGTWFTTAAALDLARDRMIIGAIDGRIRILEWSSGILIQELQEQAAAIRSILVRSNGDILAASDDGAAKLYRGGAIRAAVTFMHFSDREWLVVVEEGYFNASRRAADQILFRAGRTVYPLNQFYDVFYRPDIVEAKLRGEDIAPLVRITVEEALAAPPPVVEIVGTARPIGANRSTIAFRVKSTGGGVGDVRVFHNGKLVLSDALQSAPVAEAPMQFSEATPEAITRSLRGLAIAQRKEPARVAAVKPDFIEGTVTIESIPGENEIAVVAFNRTNSVQSELRSTVFIGDGVLVPPRLFVLAVGIDQYAESPLKFAVKDARDMGRSIVALARTLYADRIHLTELHDAQAGKAGIVSALERIAQEARPWDSVILFVASHGMMRGDEYVMATYDYRRSANQDWFLSTTELLELSKRIPALDQMFIFDTCHAGGLNTMVSGLYDARMTVLAKNMGLHILTSASKTQEAIDGYQGNGLFTHALLDAFRDRRTDTNNDNRVSVTELAASARQRVLEIGRRIRYQQTPVAAHFGKDRTLYELANQ